MHSKKYKNISSKLDKEKVYDLDTALDLITSNSAAKFDETIELHLVLGIDPDKTEQQVRDSLVLPNGGIQKKKVAAFVKPEDEKKAKKAGADIVGGKELIKDIKKNKKTDFDIAIAHPEMMQELSKIARILGPKRLMPSPKNGTITENIEQTIKELKSGKIFFRNDSGGNVHFVIGKTSWKKDKIKENFNAVIDKVKKIRPSKVKRKNLFKKVCITSTMGPSIKVKVLFDAS